MKHKFILLNLFLLILPLSIAAQSMINVKSNLLYDATGTLNLGIEKSFGRKLTLEMTGNYNPWQFSENYKWKHWLLQPEFRYWYVDAMAGHFGGIHALVGAYNVAWKDTRYQGNLVGAGFTYGYAWVLSPHWGLETSLGLGYMRLDYDYFECVHCADVDGSEKKNYVGPTKAAISLFYVF